MKISAHYRLGDWCHICGKRKCPTVDVWYPENAEHQHIDVNYIRICSKCLTDMYDAIVHAELKCQLS